METKKKSRIRSIIFPPLVVIIAFGNVIIWHHIITTHHHQVDDEPNNNKNIAIVNGVFIDESFRVQKKSNNKEDNLVQRSIQNTNTTSSTSATATTDNITEHDIPQDGFSACLLIKNDNEKLAEWLAYHWLTLPLKYLIVAVDPTGTTSPQHVLELWNTTNMGMEIELWHDDTYDHWINEELDEKHKHRDRQKRFLAECQLYHKKKGRTWLAVIDPDEYITYNTINADDPKYEMLKEIPTKFLEKGYMQQMMNIRKDIQTNLKQYQHQTLFSFINNNKEKEPWISEPCYLMPRLFFSAIESPIDIIAKAKAEEYGFDPMDFSTLRYFHHAKRGGFDYNHYGKVIVDMSRIKLWEIEHDMYSVHRPNYNSCLPPTKPYFDGVLRVHHYLGSWEQYSSRSDVRRSRERFNKFAFVDYGVDYQLQFWLEQFVEMVGSPKAKMLLNSSGTIEIGSVRLMDREDFVYSQPRLDKLAGEKEELIYFFDEDGSVVYAETKDGKPIEHSF